VRGGLPSFDNTIFVLPGGVIPSTRIHPTLSPHAPVAVPTAPSGGLPNLLISGLVLPTGGIHSTLSPRAPVFVPAGELNPIPSPDPPVASNVDSAASPISREASSNQIRFFYANARSVVNKLNGLHDLLYSCEYDVICFSETWLSDKVTDGLLDPKSRYNLYRCDRPGLRQGGGVMIAVHKNIRSSLLPLSLLDVDLGAELISCAILTCTIRIIVTCVYLPPNLPGIAFAGVVEKMNKFFAQGGCSILLGDFNLPKLDWGSNVTTSDSKSRLFYDFANDHGLTQLVSESTRGDNTLDLVLCNDPLLISDVETSPPFGSSDHDSITFRICDLNACAPTTSVTIRSWKKADWQLLAGHYFNLDWRYIFSPCHTADQCWASFLDAIYGGIDLYVPACTIRPGCKVLQSKAVRKLTKKKLRCWREWRLHKSPTAYESYKRVRNQYKDALTAQVIKQELSVIHSGTLGAFYKHVNARRAHQSGIAPLRDASNTLCVEDSGKAEILNQAFASVGIDDDGRLPDFPDISAGNSLSMVHFDFALLVSCINRLKSTSTSGPDGLPNILFKELKHQLAGPLSMLFNLIMQLGCVPAAWTLSHVTPIFKKGSPADPLNYRPISLTAVCSKLFEAGIKSHLIEYVTDLGVLTPDQHGFLARRSTCSNLLEAFDGWTRNLDLKSDTLVANIDFAKAFDSVSVSKLIYKLSRFGIKGKLSDCIASLLTDRHQRVKVGACLSGSRTLRSGVPQGSVLGPVLFVLFINDIVRVLPPKMCSKIFADDLKAYICVDNPLDVNTFKYALHCLGLWAETWQLPISTAKSNWMRISNKCASDDIAYDFSLCNIAIPELTEVKDLGVLFDNKLSFEAQITSVISRSKQRLFLLRRSFVSKDPCILVLAFKTYILPLLDYCSPIWAPSHITDIKRLESVQRLFTKRLLGYELLDYPQRLAKAGLCGLELRRMYADLTLCYKILHGLVIVGPLLCLDSSTSTRGHGWKLKPTTPRLDSRLHFFAYRVCKWWNILRSDTVNAKSVDGFKALLRKEDLSSLLLNPL
jgi:hypothetical protein